MIIGHKLGHLRAGHYRQWIWINIPVMVLLPILWRSYLRATEYTADRYGFLAADRKKDVVFGLILLAGSSEYVAKKISERAYSDNSWQWVRNEINEWLLYNPPLVKRLGCLFPELVNSNSSSTCRLIVFISALILDMLPILIGSFIAIVLFLC